MMTKTERAEKKASHAASAARMSAAIAKAIAIVNGGKCPDCGAGLRRNLALSGWWQCEQFGDGHFRKDQSKPKCCFQCFTA